MPDNKSPFPLEYSAAEFGFNRQSVSPAALDVVQRLQESGYEAYLVGGCVRDLLLGVEPKDFDVTTDATPEQVRQIFHRSRIIGRRFKIVHVRYGREIIEVSTYRAKPEQPKKSWFKRKITRSSSSERILDDNVYGAIDEDVMRRDFTVNALYYDPQGEKVLDFLQGVEDVRARKLKMIGDIRQRFAEDPVRMLRVVRFKAKLGLEVDNEIEEAMEECVGRLDEVPAARLYDEVLKLFHHAHAVRSWEELKAYSLLGRLFPQTLHDIEAEGNGEYESLILAALANTDSRVSEGKPVIAAFLFAILLWLSFKERYQQAVNQGINYSEAVWVAGDQAFARQCRIISVPRRVSTPVVEIWAMQFRLEQRRPRAVERLLENRRFRAAYDFLVLRQKINEVDKELVDWWTEIQDQDPARRREMINTLRPSSGRGRPGKNRKKSSRSRRRRPRKTPQMK